MRHALAPLFILWLLLLPTLGLTQELSCPNHPVDVSTGDKDDIVLIRLAADKALSFLSEYNLAPIHIDIVDHNIDNQDYDAYGSIC